MKRLSSILLMLAALMLAASPALAHMPWLSVAECNPAVGKKVKIMIGWGHKFPLDDFAKAEDMAGVTLYDPQGKAVKLAASNEFMFETEALTVPGAYLVAAQKKPGFYTKLEKGFARTPKTGLSGVKSCSHSLSFMKTVVNVGDGKGDVSRKLGHELELVPLKNPGELKVGDTLPIQVLFKGQPVDDYPLVLATYAGFPDSHAFAHTSHAGNDGVAKVRILHNGAWMVMVNLKKHYPDPKECDQTSYTAALTFEIK